MAFASPARPLAHASADVRVEYLQRVLLWTVGGLIVSATAGTLAAGGLYLGMAAGVTILFNNWVMLGGIFGSYAVAHYVAPRMVFGEQKVLGFGLGAVFQGLSMGWLLLFAVLMGAQQGNPFGLVGTALGLTGLTGLGMTAYVWTKPREFKLLGAGLSALAIPMLVLMGLGLVMPGLFGGTLGLILCAAFVVISAGGLLYQINSVLHRLSSDEHIEGAYLITMGVLILFWNILSLLMRLNRD